MIVAEHLRKTFPGRGKDKNRVIAVDDVGFTAHDGQITGLLGPNGAGKTTTLRMLYTLMAPESGRVVVDGIDVAADPERVRRNLGVLPDARGVYKRLTARENIDYFGELHGMSGAELRERSRSLLQLLGLEPLADRRVAGFSQGERTKVALARALVHSPRNVILDEPTAALGVQETAQVENIIRGLKDRGIPMILISHNLRQVFDLVDRIVVFRRGRIVRDGFDLATAGFSVCFLFCRRLLGCLRLDLGELGGCLFGCLALLFRLLGRGLLLGEALCLGFRCFLGGHLAACLVVRPPHPRSRDDLAVGRERWRLDGDAFAARAALCPIGDELGLLGPTNRWFCRVGISFRQCRIERCRIVFLIGLESCRAGAFRGRCGTFPGR